MAESPDAQTQLKKRARRRLMGAVAFAALAAVVLPMVMDEEPKQQMQDVQIRIPGQDQPPLAAVAPAFADKPAASDRLEVAPAKELAAPRQVDTQPPKAAESTPAKSAERTPEKSLEKKAEKSERAEKAPDRAAKQSAEEAQRAAAILTGKAAEVAVAAHGTQHLILIGAFSNAANVKQLEAKIAELGIKTFAEPLDSPEGKKTRLRAGPFASRDAADKALDRMKRIGINGVVAAK
jgi:DedD protein